MTKAILPDTKEEIKNLAEKLKPFFNKSIDLPRHLEVAKMSSQGISYGKIALKVKPPVTQQRINKMMQIFKQRIVPVIELLGGAK